MSVRFDRALGALMTSVSGVDSGQPPASSPVCTRGAVVAAGSQAVVVAVMAVRCLAAMLFPAVRQVGWPDLVVALVAGVALIVVLASGRPSLPRALAATAAMSFWLVTAVSALAFDQPIPVAAVSMALTAAVLILGPSDSPWPLRIVILAGSLVALLSIVAGALSLSGAWSGGIYGTEVYQRETFGLPALSGVAGHPNTLAQIVGLTLILALAVALSTRARGAVVLPVVALIPLLWTQSRTSVAAALLAAAALVLLIKLDRWRPWLVGVALLVAVAPPLLWLRAGQFLPVDAIFTGRPIAWAASTMAAAVSPFLGQGPGVMSREFWRALGMSPDDQWQPLHAHNEVLETLAQAGLVGLACLLALTLVGVVVALTRSGSNGRMCAAVFLFFGLQAGVEVPLGLTYFPAGYLLPTMVVAAMSYGGSLAWRSRSEAREGG